MLISFEKFSPSVMAIMPMSESLVSYVVLPMLLVLTTGPYLSNRRWLLPRWSGKTAKTVLSEDCFTLPRSYNNGTFKIVADKRQAGRPRHFAHCMPIYGDLDRTRSVVHIVQLRKLSGL